jgi:hypothetical protein
MSYSLQMENMCGKRNQVWPKERVLQSYMLKGESCAAYLPMKLMGSVSFVEAAVFFRRPTFLQLSLRALSVAFIASTLARVQVAFDGPLKGDGNEPQKAVKDAVVDFCEGKVEKGWCAKSDPLVGCSISGLGSFGCWGRESFHGCLGWEHGRTVGALFSGPHFERPVGRACTLLEYSLCVLHWHSSPTCVCDDGAKILLLGIAKKAAIVM